MFRRNVFAVAVALGMMAAAPIAASAQEGISGIQGRWVEDRTGEPLVITRSPFGYETWLAWIGQASITSAFGHQGADIKIESADRRRDAGIKCFYKVSSTSPRRMIWAIRQGSDERCPQAGAYSMVQ